MDISQDIFRVGGEIVGLLGFSHARCQSLARSAENWYRPIKLWECGTFPLNFYLKISA